MMLLDLGLSWNTRPKLVMKMVALGCEGARVGDGLGAAHDG